MMIRLIQVNSADVREALLKSVSLVKEKPDLTAEVERSDGSFMEIREILKECFDVLDDPSTENYIGILEWAVVQQIADNFSDKDAWLNISEIYERFFGHPNIELIN